jgi:hypothetical protein
LRDTHGWRVDHPVFDEVADGRIRAVPHFNVVETRLSV